MSNRNLPTEIPTPSPSFFLARSSRSLSRSLLSSAMLPSSVGKRHTPLPVMRRRTVSCQATEWSENSSGQAVGRVMARSSSLGHEQCSQRGSPSVLGLDGGRRRSAVPSGLFQKLPHAPRPKTVSPAVPGSPPRNEMTGAPRPISKQSHPVRNCLCHPSFPQRLGVRNIHNMNSSASI